MFLDFLGEDKNKDDHGNYQGTDVTIEKKQYPP